MNEYKQYPKNKHQLPNKPSIIIPVFFADIDVELTIHIMKKRPALPRHDHKNQSLVIVNWEFSITLSLTTIEKNKWLNLINIIL